jgi:hypothetical protein
MGKMKSKANYFDLLVQLLTVRPSIGFLTRIIGTGPEKVQMERKRCRFHLETASSGRR